MSDPSTYKKNVEEWMQYMDNLSRSKAEEGKEIRIMDDCFRRATVVSAEADRVVFELKVLSKDCNQADNFHGGAIATLIDNLTSGAMFTQERKYFRFAGVSSDLHISYVSGAPLGSTVLFDCKVHKVGANLASLTCIVYDKATKRVVATGSHTKFNTDALYGYVPEKKAKL
ncbi:hypothetical protein BGZ73_003268 [Actinomortierella ambigua]|nr:hypothetical protein BGZ73_003268 [Actinomortierella ambigua]